MIYKVNKYGDTRDKGARLESFYCTDIETDPSTKAMSSKSVTKKKDISLVWIISRQLQRYYTLSHTHTPTDANNSSYLFTRTSCDERISPLFAKPKQLLNPINLNKTGAAT